MNFELSEQQKLLLNTSRTFMEREIIPIADELDRQGPLPRDLALSLIKKLIPLGYLDGPFPREEGGQGLDLVSWGMLMEELSRAWASLAGIVLIYYGSIRYLTRFGTEEQKKMFLGDMLSADRMPCHCYVEPNAGSNLASLETTALPDGDDFVINGTKIFVSNGPIADVAWVLAATERSKGTRGTSLLMVDKEISPFSARTLVKLGLNAWPTGELSFEDCRVPRQNLVAMEGAGYRETLAFFAVARCVLAAMSVGIAQAAIDAAINYARERQQFDRPIGSFQLVQGMVYDMLVETEAARLLTYRGFDLIDKGERVAGDAAMAKAYATEMAVRVTSKAIQIHGGYGLCDNYALERYFKDARSMTIPDGTTEIQKLIVGREALGLSAIA